MKRVSLVLAATLVATSLTLSGTASAADPAERSANLAKLFMAFVAHRARMAESGCAAGRCRARPEAATAAQAPAIPIGTHGPPRGTHGHAFAAPLTPPNAAL